MADMPLGQLGHLTAEADHNAPVKIISASVFEEDIEDIFVLDGVVYLVTGEESTKTLNTGAFDELRRRRGEPPI